MKPILILFGSQTGAAKSIAESLHAAACSKGISAVLAPLNDYSKVDFCESSIAIIVCSTTGNGDPPNNAEDFWRFIRKRTHPKDLLAHLKYTMLGLGDTNYDKFCACSKGIMKRFSELAAQPFYAPAFADEAVGLESVVDPWTKGLWSAIDSASGDASQQTVAVHPPGRDNFAAESAFPLPLTVSSPPDCVDPVDAKAHSPAEVAGSGLHSPMAQMAAVKAIQVEQRKRSRLASMDGIGSINGLDESGHEGGVLHLHTHGVSGVSAGDGPLSPGLDIVLHTEGKGVDEIVEAAAQAAASAVGSHMTRMQERGRGNGNTTAVASLHIDAPMQHSASAPDLAQMINGAGEAKATGVTDTDTDAGVGLGLPILQVPNCVTAGVRSVWSLFPQLVHHSEAAGSGSDRRPEDVIPPAAVTSAAKFFPPRPPVTLAVRMSLGGVSQGHNACASGSPALSPAGTALHRSGFAINGTVGAVCSPSNGSLGNGSSLGRTLETPVTLPVTGARYLTSGGRESDRRVVHMELGVAGTPLAGSSSSTGWFPGDAVGIIAPNDACEVSALCSRLGVQPQARMELTSLSTSASASAGSAASVVNGGVPHTPSPLSSPGRPSTGSARTDRSSSPHPPPSLPMHFPSWLPGHPHPTLTDVLTWCVDIRSSPKRAFLRLLGEACSAEQDRDACLWLAGKAGKDAFKVTVEDQRLTLLDLLALFPSCAPPLDALLSALPPLAPRYYSLTSSPLANPHAMTFAFTVVESALPLDTPLPEVTQPATHIHRHGLASCWLESLAAPFLAKGAGAVLPAVHVRAFLRPSKDFFPPASLTTPLVMIGPGTGVAPFIGFLQHRAAKREQHEAAATAACTGMWRGMQLDCLREDRENWQPVVHGDAVLFFGNRRADIDFLYQNELSRYLADGHLTRLVTAWSREVPGVKTYVQHKLGEEENARAVVDLVLCKGAHVYVCGDGGAMARDVHAALTDCLTRYGHEYGGLGLRGGAETVQQGAADFLADLAKRGRYVRDIWS